MKRLFSLVILLTCCLLGANAEVTPVHKGVYTIKGAFNTGTRPIYYDANAGRFKSASAETGTEPQKFVFFSSPYTNNAGLVTFKMGVVEGDGFLHYDPNNNGKVTKANAASVAFPTSSTELTSPIVFENGGVAPGYNGMVGLGGANIYRSYVVQSGTTINYNTRSNSKVNASSTLGATNAWQSNYLIEEVPDYDVYDVVLTGNVLAGTTVSYTGTGCLTTTAQVNGGYFVLPTGASKTQADFGNTPASISINETDKIITFDFPVPVNTTYVFTNVLGDEVSKTVSAYLNENSENFIPEVPFFAATGVTEGSKTITADAMTFHVSGNWNLPFTPGKVCRLKVRNGNGKTVAYANPKPVTNSSTGSNFAKENLWTIEAVANTLNDFKLYNLGAEQYISGNGFSAEGHTYTIGVFPGTTDRFNLVVSGTTNNSLGDHASSNTQLGEWSGGSNKNDAGSCFWTESIASEIAGLPTSAGEVFAPSFLTDGMTVHYYSAEKATAAATDPSKENIIALFASAQDNIVPAHSLSTSKYYRLANYDTARSHGNWVGTTCEANTEGEVNASSERKVKSNVTDGGVAALWQFVEDSENPNTYYVKNVNSGTSLFSTTTNGSEVDTPIDDVNAGTFTLSNVSGQWWAIKTASASEWLHQSNHGDNKLLIWNTVPSLTDGRASLWSIEEVESVPVTVSAAGFATINFPMPVSIPGDVIAYQVTEKALGKYMMLQQVTGSVAANTPLIIEAEPSIYYFGIEETGTPYTDNLLSGTTVKRSGFTGDHDFYALAQDEEAKAGASFMYNNTVNSIPANKAYLEGDAVNNVKAFYFNFGEDLTGIENTTLLPNADTFYNLKGQPVAQPTHGIYVKANGQKVYIK